MANEIDPRLLSRLAANRTTRRRFLGGGAAAAAALTLGPSFLAACGGDDSPAANRPRRPRTREPASGTLRISNWPLYMADGFVAAFQTASGITVDYKEDFNDNEQWFAKVKEPLSRKQDIGADLAVPTTFMAVRLHSLGWLNDISDAGWSNKKNLRPDLLEASVDPDRKFSAPYMSGLVGLAYNRAATGRDITTIDDLWDPAFKGRVSLFSDFQDGLGMIMLSQGSSVEEPTTETIQKAVDVVTRAEGQGPDPTLHRQRLRRRSRRRECGHRPGVFGRRRAAAGRQPGPAVRRPGVRRDNLRRHHGDPVHHAEPEGGRSLDQLCLRPPQLRQTRRVHRSTCRCCRI